MKKTVNDICGVFVGRHIHPIASTIGGFTQLPNKEKLDQMLELFYGMRSDMEATIALAKTLRFPEFERDTEYVALVSNDNEYPILSGEIGSTDGARLPKKDYRKVTNEFIVPHSSAKHAKWNRSSYAVGALARFNLNSAKLHPKAQEVARAIGLKPKCINPYLNTAAQLVECIHCLEDSIRILEHYKKAGIDHKEEILVALNENKAVPVKAGTGVGAVEVPRGILFHEYEIDKDGIIVNANCIIPTSQNVNNAEEDMKKLVPEILDKKDEEITLALEMLVRAYDPCISCSAHFLDVKFVNR
jgi:coenzyme F420-reducing hydrogenase alpha subunit